MKRERILFIVNPISGGEEKNQIPLLIDENLNHDFFDAETVFTEYVGHATELAKEALNQGFDIVASVGGDGTINEVASALVFSGKKMAIIPGGSGNGLARTLNIPLNKAKAIRRINNNRFIEIDSATFNHRNFFNVAGMGFDAHISALFAETQKRGVGGYITNVLREIKNYKPKQYQINVDGTEYNREAFMVSIANSTQYGNNAHISPFAKVNDGLLDLCIIKPFPLYVFPLLVYKMLAKTVHTSKYVEIVKGQNIKITRKEEDPVHIDGEPLVVSREITIQVNHLSLKIMV